MRLRIGTKVGIIFFIFLVEILIFMFILSIVVGQYEYYMHKLHEEIEELDLVKSLQLALVHVIMPANDFLIPGGDPNELENFKLLSTRVEDLIERLEKKEFDRPEEGELINYIKEEYFQVKKISLQIFSIPNAIGNIEAGRLMEEIDRIVDDASMEAEKFHQFAHQEIEEAQTGVQKTKNQINLVILIGILFSTGLILAGLIFFRRSISSPIVSLRDASLRVGEGNLEATVNVRLKDEIGELGAAFNKMVEGLKKSQDGLLSAKTYTEGIISSIVDILIVLNPDATIKMVNKATLDLLGYKEEELIGRPVEKILVEEITPFKGTRLNRLIAEGSIKGYEMTYKTKTGGQIPVSFSGSVMHGKEKDVIGIVGVARDMRPIKGLISNLQSAKEALEQSKQNLESNVEDSEKQRLAILNILDDVDEAHNELVRANKKLKQTQEQLIQAGKLSAIGQLAGGVAHEINNPLTGVLNNVELIKLEAQSRKDFDLKDFQELLDIVEESAHRCVRITRALLDFSRRSKGEFEPLNINEVIKDAFVLGSHELKLEEIEIVKELRPDLPAVLGNSTQLQQVLLDLISNAKNALRDVKEKKRLVVETSASPDKNLVQIKFSDNGCGVPKENLNKIFEPFFTTMEVGKGTGLGLSISYGIIQAHRGNIEVTSKEGKGTTFTITLPVAEKT